MALAHRVTPEKRFRLSDIDPDDTGPYRSREQAGEDFVPAITRLSALQERLYAEKKQSLLVVLQAMDTAGKDGVVRKVIGPLDARGVHVWSFGVPSECEREHDFLWRVHAQAPRHGEMCVFNRSHYEDVLVVRVLGLRPRSVWSRRYAFINEFERMLVAEGTTVVKIFLHISKEEQAERLQERLDDPEKRWKFNLGDLEMRKRWDDFMEAYEEALGRCSTEEAPWYVVPANKKWFRDVAVAQTLVDALERMDPKFPRPDFDPAGVVVR